ncbi:PREDICTED: sine oculis-binding protein homolog [Nicrophorus vespilloides]|uniref:Sine oculis-binding protein homolog n=1 Tax=Nicrophorus vespilloides TaxID=110193 RepID=A0ABM1MJC2_NICVS|nr:PREDICTED: sine oculis-binding protein homolog [Nicrophorus vespilloides]
MDNTTVAEEGQVKNKIVTVKKERADEEIKEFAETAMNELLGWYGYGPNHSKDIMQQRTTNSCKSRSNSNSSGPDSPKFTEGCGWCGKVVDDSNGLSSGSSTFCSELCFSQSRRANFKKNKTCDWCRHVRHTVSYVDFQDGASQLQFCSDKCLNQYKMHIFCRETRAHLEMHPHLIGEDSTTAGLITPDLWLKNCKSPPLSLPTTTTTTLGAPTSRTPSPVCREEQTSPLPLITVAHPSKLLASPPDRIRSPRVKRTRKRQPSTATKVSESPQDLRIRHSPIPDPPHVYPPHQPHQPQQPPSTPHPAAPDHHYYHHQLPSFPPHPMLMRPTNSVLPPVTVMVPYPVAVPIPIPIPIPLPLSSFLKAAEIKNNLLKEAAAVAAATAASQNTEESSQNTTAPVEDEPEVEQEVEDTKEDEIVVDDVKTSPTRSVRKRKRVVEAKAKIVLKSKKPLSV